MIYRREIDGLRAVAVLPVIFYHAGFQVFSGGFVGVDVFFVISGYLIASILMAEREASTFSLANFYERRARRILPALFFVMFACLPFAWLWLLPAEMKGFSKSIIAVSAFASNVLFWRETNYFETAAELKPLLHTWSLALEEQYYLLFPVFLMLAWQLGKRSILLLLLVSAGLSLAAAQWGALNRPQAAFYLLPTRAWELLIGAALALYLGMQKNNRLIQHGPAAEALSAAGLLMIVYAVLFFSPATPVPGLYLLVPTVGTALVICFAGGRTVAGKVLATPLLAGIGLISYSAYLWHQPLFAFARHRSASEPGELMLGTLAGTTLVLAYLSWRFIERPFRDVQRISRRQLVCAGAACTLALLGLGVAGMLQQGYASRFDPSMAGLILPPKTTFESRCALRPFADEPALKLCEFGDVKAKTTFALYGDSHAQALFGELEKALLAKNIKGVFLINEACTIPHILDSRTRAGSHDCARASARMYRYLKAEVKYVAVSVRWTYRLYPIAGVIDRLEFDNGERGVEDKDSPRTNFTLAYGGYSTGGEGKKRAINDFVANLASNSEHLILIYPVPEAGWNIPKLNFLSYLSKGAAQPLISTSFSAYQTRNAFIETTLNAIAPQPHLLKIEPSALLCDTMLKGRCLAQSDSVPLYYDDDHLSNAGARMVIDHMLQRLDL